MIPWRRLQPVALAALLIFYAAHALLLAARLRDDAFISFRYARHLAEGAGLVWNVGERVEGYTNFLWTLLLALPFLASKAAVPVTYARALSLASGATSILASFFLVRRLAPKSALLALVPPLLLAGNWSFAINTMTGLETVFFSALVTLTVLLLVFEHDDLRYRGSSLLAALAALTRPEATALFPLLLLAAFLAIRKRPGARPYLLRLAVPFAAVVGAHEIFRLAYYGQLVPNTFFAKFGVPLPPSLPTRTEYLTDFLTKGTGAFGAFSALAAVFLVSTARLSSPRAAAARPIALTVLFGLANVAVSGADFMIGFRYLIPYLPLLYVATALGAAALIDLRRSRSKPKKSAPSGFPVEALVAVAAMFTATQGYAHSRDDLRPFEELRRRISEDTAEALGRWMSAHLPAGTKVAAADIGALGFYSDLPIIDLTGLTDRAIARRPGDVLDRSLDLDDLFSRGLGAVVLVSRSPGLPRQHAPLAAYWPPGSSRAVLTDPRMSAFPFTARYPSYVRLAPSPDDTWQPTSERTEGTRENTYFLELYLRSDLVPPAPLD